MNKILTCMAIFVGVLCVTVTQHAMALESDLNDFVHGFVVEISAEQIVVQEIKEEGGQISQFEIKISENTLFEKDITNEDISQGDEVEIQYKETKNGKVAILIKDKTMAKEKMDMLEEKK